MSYYLPPYMHDRAKFGLLSSRARQNAKARHHKRTYLMDVIGIGGGKKGISYSFTSDMRKCDVSKTLNRPFAETRHTSSGWLCNPRQSSPETGNGWATISPRVFSFFLTDLRHRLNWEETVAKTKILGSAEAKLVPAWLPLCAVDTLERGFGEGSYLSVVRCYSFRVGTFDVVGPQWTLRTVSLACVREICMTLSITAAVMRASDVDNRGEEARGGSRTKRAVC
ncbi:hypothetical protein V8E52_011632 [Russula decolorans]|jgi:hypothetical protein